jgi:hypothetical protein
LSYSYFERKESSRFGKGMYLGITKPWGKNPQGLVGITSWNYALKGRKLRK